MNLSPNNIPEGIHTVCERFHSNSFKVFLVGGSIRDLLRGKTRPNDWDLATDALPSDVISIFSEEYRVIPTGLKHGTVTLLFEHLTIEITTFRIEGNYLDGRHPEDVSFVSDIKEDLSRRDLTINAIAYDPIEKKIVDPFNGVEDIHNKVVRLVGAPAARLEEDGLRLIRIFRFISQLGYSIDERTFKEVSNHFEIFNLVAKERIQTELQKLIAGEFWKDALLLMNESGLLLQVIPEFQAPNLQEVTLLGLSRLEITIKIIQKLPVDASLNLRFAALFHQISALSGTDSSIFPEFKEKVVRNTLKRMKFPKKQINNISHILREHATPFPFSSDEVDEEKRNYLTRRLLFQIKPEFFDDYLALLHAKEAVNQEGSIFNENLFQDIVKRSKIQKPVYLKDLKVNGNDIVSQLGLDKSKSSQREFISLCLELLRERVELNPEVNSEEELLSLLREIKHVVSLCTLSKKQEITIVSTDHIRKIYRDNKPEYTAWENAHTYNLAKWIVKCLLQNKKAILVFFDATNFNFPSHPEHRENIFSLFKQFNPIFVHLDATEEEVKLNIASREKEKKSLTRSDADLLIFHRYKEILLKYPDALRIPIESQMVTLNTRSQTYSDDLENLVKNIIDNDHKLVILSGNVLTGKTYTALKLKDLVKLKNQNKN